MGDRILCEFVQIKEYTETTSPEKRLSSSIISSRIVESDKIFQDRVDYQPDERKVRWVWFDGKLVKCTLVEEESAEQYGQILSLVLLEAGPTSSITGTVDFVKKEDPGADYVLVSGRSRHGVLRSLSDSKVKDLNFKPNITLKDLDNRPLCKGFMRLNNPFHTPEVESRYYPALFIGRNDETWKSVVRLEAFNRNITFRRSDGRLFNSRYTSLKEVIIDEEAKPLERDWSISSENDPVSPISQEQQHLLLELSQPVGGKLFVSPKLANFQVLPLPCLIGLPLKLTTHLNKDEIEVYATEIADHLVVEGCGMTWGVDRNDQMRASMDSQSEIEIWAKLEKVAEHHETPHKPKKCPESLEKPIIQHGVKVEFRNVNSFEYDKCESPKLPGRSILKSSSKERFSSERRSHEERERSLSSPPRELSTVKWKDEQKITESMRQRTNSETKIISEKRTYFENGNLVSVVKEYDKDQPDTKRVPADPRLAASFAIPTIASESKKALTTYISSKAQTMLPIKKQKIVMKTKPKPSESAPETSLMKAFDLFVGSLPAKIAPELVFPLFKEMTARAVNLTAEYKARPELN